MIPRSGIYCAPKLWRKGRVFESEFLAMFLRVVISELGVGGNQWPAGFWEGRWKVVSRVVYLADFDPWNPPGMLIGAVK
jgi:hypothetical protein